MLKPEEEKKYEEIRAKCRELGVPSPPEIHLNFKVYDHNGVLTYDDTQRGHSWVRNLWNLQFATCTDCGGDGTSLYAPGHLTVKQISGTINGAVASTAQRNGSSIAGYGMTGAINDQSVGIVVGISDAVWNFNQYVLGSLISSGSGSGQLAYQAQAAPVASYNGGTYTWSVVQSRTFNNNSGASITVKEAGLYWKGTFFSAVAGQSFMLERTVCDPTVTVANAAQLVATYTISQDFTTVDTL